MLLRLAFLTSITAAGLLCAASAQAKTMLAFTTFEFKDTSGEVRDQTADHERRMTAFMTRLKEELGKGDKFELTEVACADPQCRPDDTIAKAREEHKPFVVFGALQKTSTLVLWAKVDVVDSTTSNVVFTRWITFRGDTDEAWGRTGRYIGRAMTSGRQAGQ